MSLAAILLNATEITSVYLVELSALKVVKYWTADPTSPSSAYETPYPFDGDAYVTGVFYGDSTTPQAVALTLAASAADVQTTPGSYFWDRTNLYVQPPEETQLTTPGFFTPDPRAIGNTVTVQLTYYFCSHTAKIFNGIYYQPLLVTAPQLSLRVEQDFSGVGQVSGAATVFDNSAGFFDLLTNLNWDGGRTVVRLGADQPTINVFMDYSDYELIGTWLNDNWTKTNQTFTVNNLELKQILTQNLPQRYYSTDLYPHMSTNDINSPIPLAYGQIFGAPPVCIDTVNKIFKVADEKVHPIFSIDAVRQATATTWQDIAFTADLVNGQLTIPAWDGVSNISVDFHGYVKPSAGGTWMDNAADMVQDILTYIGQTQVDQPSFDASHAALAIGTLNQPSNIDTFALELPSTPSYVSAGYNSALDTVTGDFTIEGWIYQNSTNSAGIFYRGNGPGSGPLVFGLFGSGQLGVKINGPSFTLLGGVVPVGQEVHVAVTRTGSTIKLWINGVQSGSTGTYGTTISYSGEAVAAGYYFAPNPTFNGYLSEMRLSNICRYTSPFTPARILGSDANTKLYWKFNDGAGTTAVDSSASGITGTLQGSAKWITINPLQDVSQLVPSIYINQPTVLEDLIQEINQVVGSYLFVDPTGTYRYVVFVPQPGEGLLLFDATSIINFQKDNPSMICQSQVILSFANRLSEGWGQLLTESNPTTQFSIGQTSPIGIGPQPISLSTLADATYWAFRQLIFWGKKPDIYTLSLPWALLLQLPTNQIHIQYPRHTIDAIFEIVEVDSQGSGLDSYANGQDSSANGSAGGTSSGGGLSCIVSNLHNFDNTCGFWALPDGFTSGEEGIPTRFANLAGYGTGGLEWNAGWDPAIKSWAMQNVGYWTDNNGFICDFVTGLPDPVTQGHSVWF